MDWSPDGERIASASDDRTVRIWLAGQGTEITRLHGHDLAVRVVAWSPDGQRLATGSNDRTARIWNPKTGAELLTLSGHDRPVWGLAWSPDGTRIAAASRDSTVRIWDATVSLAALVERARSRILRSLTADERRSLMLPAETSTADPKTQ